MKTLDEVIKAYECCEHGEPDSNCEECSYIGVGACCLERENDALHYLKSYKDDKEDLTALRAYWAEQQKNEPLTWDELKGMEGMPVWVEQCNGDTKGWLLILRTNYDVINCTTKHGNSFYLYKSSYGEKWQAYRKEKTDG